MIGINGDQAKKLSDEDLVDAFENSCNGECDRRSEREILRRELMHRLSRRHPLVTKNSKNTE